MGISDNEENNTTSNSIRARLKETQNLEEKDDRLEQEKSILHLTTQVINFRLFFTEF